MELHVEDLCKSYNGRLVLENVTFTAGPGVTCVMAPSGAGKTTLLRILMGLERPDSGSFTGNVRWAAVFQEDRLLEHLDAMENLRFVLGSALDESAANVLLTELGLGDTAGKPVREFWLWPGPCWHPLTLWRWTSPLPAWTRKTGHGARR